MARNRTPLEKAEVSGRAERDPKRFRGRTKHTGLRPLGEPYARMTEAEKEAWQELQDNMPWLKSSHRQIVRLTCTQIAKLEDGTITVTGTRALSGLLAKLGATPVDQCRVNALPSEDEDPDDEFFATH